MPELTYRTRNFLLAAILAVAAFALTLIYVSHARSASPRSHGTGETVLVATRDIPVGTTGAELTGGGWVKPTPIDAADAAPGVAVNTNQLAQLVAVQPTYAGEQLLTRRFGPTQQEGVLSLLHGAYRIVDLPGDANQLLNGVLKQGNRVDLVGSVRIPESGVSHSAAIALRDLLVVSAPAKSDTDSSGADYVVELQVTTAQLQRLFWIEQNATWSLALRPATGATYPHNPPTTALNALGSSNGD
jgi:Flp pilus assembly protein CpaB